MAPGTAHNSNRAPGARAITGALVTQFFNYLFGKRAHAFPETGLAITKIYSGSSVLCVCPIDHGQKHNLELPDAITKAL